MRDVMKRPILALTAIASLLCTVSGDAAGTAIQKSVLLIYDARSDMLGNIVVDQAIRHVLNEAYTVNLDIRSEYFEPSASPEKDFPRSEERRVGKSVDFGVWRSCKKKKTLCKIICI